MWGLQRAEYDLEHSRKRKEISVSSQRVVRTVHKPAKGVNTSCNSVGFGHDWTVAVEVRLGSACYLYVAACIAL